MNPPAKSSESDKLLEQLNVLIEENLTNEDFGVEQLASSIGYSRSHLHRKLQKQTGKTISQYIREYRLEKAYSILKNENLNVSEVGYMVGFGSATYFSRSFNSYFGFPPSEVKDRASTEHDPKPDIPHTRTPKSKLGFAILFSALAILVLGSSFIFLLKWLPDGNYKSERSKLSVALMPLANLSNDPMNQYLVQGVGDAIARKLSGLDDLRVISQTSTAQLDAAEKSVIQLAQKLDSDYVLEGSIQKFGEQMRIEVGLVNGKNGVRVWSEHYDRDFKDIFDIENEIAEHVASSLITEISPEDISILYQGYTSNARAYELYLKGVFELRTYTRTGVHLAQDYFKEAITLDPDFAMAHNRLGHTYVAQAAMFGAELNALEGLEKAIIPIEKSLKIDPDLTEARPIRGFYYLYHDWNFDRAEIEYRVGIANNHPDGLMLYADYLNFLGRHEEALALCMKLEETEPYYPNTRMILSLYYNGRMEEALEYAETRLKIMKNYYILDNYGFVLLNSGNYQKAIEVFQQIFEIENIRYPRILGWMGAAYARLGNLSMANSIIEELQELKEISSAGAPAFFLATIYAALGDSDDALRWIKVAIEDHEMEIPWLISEPQFYDLHELPEFREMAHHIGFPSW